MLPFGFPMIGLISHFTELLANLEERSSQRALADGADKGFDTTDAG